MDDLISRRTAIDAVHKDYDTILDFKSDGATVASSIEDILLALPSAQPEQAIKDCRNCKHGRYNDHWDTYFCYCPNDCNDWDKWEPSTQPSEIQDILNYLDTVLHPTISPEHWNVYSELYDMISTLPSAQPERWIPVTERLPEENGRYFVTARHKGLDVITTDVLRWHGERWGWEEQSICTVLAWMPLPEPWRGEEDE